MPHPHNLLPTIAGMLLLLFFGCTLPGYAQDNPCDPGLLPLSKGPLRYEQRGDRCEGLYYQDKASPMLSLVSLTESFEKYNLKSTQELVIEWKTPKNAQKVRLRAQSVKSSLYYRMDAIRASGATTYHWPLDVLQALSIVRCDIGLTAWTVRSLNGNSREVYLPLRITQTQPPSAAGNYHVQIWSVCELQEVFVSIAAIQPDGSTAQFLQDGKALGYGYYPAERAITFDIPKPEKAGIYYLEIGATLSSGGVATIEHWFYHAG